jgi:hypothetical protein
MITKIFTMQSAAALGSVFILNLSEDEWPGCAACPLLSFKELIKSIQK